MLDNITFQINNYSQEDFINLADKISCEIVPQSETIYTVDWHNLRIKYYPNVRVIKVTNSLHKFYNAEIAKLGEVNHNDFTLTNVIDTVKYLEQVFERKASEMILQGRLEYGVNVHTYNVKPFSIINRYQSLVTTATNEFYAYDNPAGKPYGKYCPFTEYKVKFYDKGKQAGVPTKNILRYEIVHNNILKTRAILGKQQITMQDLCELGNWQKLSVMLRSTYDKIRMLPFPTDNVSEYTKILCYANPTVYKDNKEALKHIKSDLEFSHHQMKYASDSPHSQLRESIAQKLDYLLSN